MKRLIYILLLVFVGIQHNYAATPTDNFASDNTPQEQCLLLSAPLNVPVGITRVEVQVAPVSVVQHRIVQQFIFSHAANTCRQNKLQHYLCISRAILVALPPQYIAFPFSWFW